MVRAKATQPEVINNYYENLAKIFAEYDFYSKPECIYNLYEKGINAEHNPPNVVAETNTRPQALTSPRATVTVLGCGNAAGLALPPYFVFKGARLLPELMANASPGAAATMSGSGWSNSIIFKDYLENHFQKFCQGQGHKLLLVDGHKSHINEETITWAKDHAVIIFVLPPHTSWVLQPLDVGCFGPFSRLYNSEAKKFMSNHPGQVITRYQVAEVACKAYSQALSPQNLQNSFKKMWCLAIKFTGI
jgi:hypothetical protein